jgi:hypothetical protein
MKKSEEMLVIKRGKVMNPADSRMLRKARGSRTHRRAGTKNALRNQRKYASLTSKR